MVECGHYSTTSNECLDVILQKPRPNQHPQFQLTWGHSIENTHHQTNSEQQQAIDI